MESLPAFYTVRTSRLFFHKSWISHRDTMPPHLSENLNRVAWVKTILPMPCSLNSCSKLGWEQKLCLEPINQLRPVYIRGQRLKPNDGMLHYNSKCSFSRDVPGVPMLAAVLPCPEELCPCPWGGYLAIADGELLQEVPQNCRGVLNQAVPQDLLSNSTDWERERRPGQNCLLEKPWTAIFKKTFQILFIPQLYFIQNTQDTIWCTGTPGNQCSDPSNNNHRSTIAEPSLTTGDMTVLHDC